MDRRKLLGVIALITGTIIIAGGLWFVFFKGDPEPDLPPEPAITDPVTGLPVSDGERIPGDTTVVDQIPGDDTSLPDTEAFPAPVAQGGETQTIQLVESDATNVVLNEDNGRPRYYDPGDGFFYDVSPDGTIRPLNETPLPNARDVAWSNSTDKAIVEFPDGANVLYDFTTKQQNTLPTHWTEFDFGPNDTEIVAKAIGFSPENRFLVVSNPDGSNATNVEHLGNNGDRVINSYSPNQQIIAFSRTGQPQGFAREEILLVGKNNENFNSLIIEGLGFQPQWSPNGEILLYSTFNDTNDLKPELWIVLAKPGNIGQARQPIGITTWANKCDFAGNTTVYCAVPADNSLPYGIGFHPSLAVGTNDSIYKIDLQNGSTTIIGKPDFATDIATVSVDEDEQFLYFTEKDTAALHQMRLK